MFLGIPFHTAMAFSIHGAWIVEADQKSALLSWGAEFSHTFRMPVFFLIAGLFAVMMIQRRGEGPWWRDRLVRLGVPLVAMSIMINPLQMLATALWRGGAEGFLPVWQELLATPGEPWIAHLWFLADLLIYCTVLALFWRIHDHPVVRGLLSRGAALLEWGRLGPALAVFLAGIFAVGSVVVLVVLGFNSLFNGMLVLARTATYLPVFLAGAVLSSRREWLDSFTRIRPVVWVLGFALALLLAAVQWREENAFRVLSYFLQPVVGILFAHILLSAARKWFNTSNRVTRAGVDASFTVYLVHQVFVAFGVLLFMGSGVPPVAQFAVIVAGATVLSLGCHAVVRRSSLLMLLFNGVLPGRRRVLAPGVSTPA